MNVYQIAFTTMLHFMSFVYFPSISTPQTFLKYYDNLPLSLSLTLFWFSIYINKSALSFMIIIIT